MTSEYKDHFCPKPPIPILLTSFGNLLLLFIAMTYILGHVWAGPLPPLEHVRARIPSPNRASFGMYPTYYLSIKMLHYIAITHAYKYIVEFLTFLCRPECNLKPFVRIKSQFFDINFT